MKNTSKYTSRLAVVAYLLSLSSLGFAQEESAKLQDVGSNTTSIKSEAPMQKPKATMVTPELSLISSTFVGGGAYDAKSITKFSVGGTIDIGESNLVTETGVLFRQIGAGESVPAKSGLTDVETDLNYLSIPVAAKYYFSNRHESSFYAKAGLAPSLLVANNVAEATHGPNVRNEDPRSFAIDALAGVGGKYQLTEQVGIVLEVSYWRGLSSIYSGANVYTSNFVNTIGFNINL